MESQLKVIENAIEKAFRQLKIYQIRQDLAVTGTMLCFQGFCGRRWGQPLTFYGSGASNLWDNIIVPKRALWHLLPQIFHRCPKEGSTEISRHISDAFTFGARYQLFYDLFFGVFSKQWKANIEGHSIFFKEASPGDCQWRAIILQQQFNSSLQWELQNMKPRLPSQWKCGKGYSVSEFKQVLDILKEDCKLLNEQWTSESSSPRHNELPKMTIKREKLVTILSKRSMLEHKVVSNIVEDLTFQLLTKSGNMTIDEIDLGRSDVQVQPLVLVGDNFIVCPALILTYNWEDNLVSEIMG